MISIQEEVLTIQINTLHPEQYFVRLGAALAATIKIVVESEEYFNDADIPDDVISLVQLLHALQPNAEQLKAISVLGKIKVEPSEKK